MNPSLIEEPRFWNCSRMRPAFLPVLAVLLFFGRANSLAQDRLTTMPGYDRFQKITRERTNAVKLGALTVTAPVSVTNEGQNPFTQLKSLLQVD